MTTEILKAARHEHRMAFEQKDSSRDHTAIGFILNYLESQTAAQPETTGCDCVTMDSRYRTEDRGPHHWDHCPMYEHPTPESESTPVCEHEVYGHLHPWPVGSMRPCRKCDLLMVLQWMPQTPAPQKAQ